MSTELDPTGKDASEPGAKLDAGKPRPSLILSDMARALSAVVDVATFGANKYSDRGWLKVENGQERYRDAADRHRLSIAMGETYDEQSKLLHKAHEAWNVLAELDLMLRAKDFFKREREWTITADASNPIYRAGGVNHAERAALFWLGIKPCGCASQALVDDETLTYTELKEFLLDCFDRKMRVKHCALTEKAFFDLTQASCHICGFNSQNKTRETHHE